MTLDQLNDDVLWEVARCLTLNREIDDVARDAAELALVGHVTTTALSRHTWLHIADETALMHPCPREQAAESMCVTSCTVSTADMTPLAEACGLRGSLHELMLWLGQSDEPVGEHCPIPRAAALYVLHMACRCMTPLVASIAYRGRDVSGCRMTRRGVLYSDLRRAPDLDRGGDRIALRTERARMLTDLDKQYLGRKRPWWVRTPHAAQRLEKRETLIADGFPESIVDWLHDCDAYNFREVCGLLNVRMKDFCDRNGPRDHQLRCQFIYRLPYVFRRSIWGATSWRLTAESVKQVTAQVREASAAIRHVPAAAVMVAYGRLHVPPRPDMPHMIPMFPVQDVVTCVLLHARGLPITPIAWHKSGACSGDVIKTAEWAQALSEYFMIEIGNSYETFVDRCNAAALAAVAEAPFELCWFDGLFVTRPGARMDTTSVDRVLKTLGRTAIARAALSQLQPIIVDSVRQAGREQELQDFVDTAHRIAGLKSVQILFDD